MVNLRSHDVDTLARDALDGSFGGHNSLAKDIFLLFSLYLRIFPFFRICLATIAPLSSVCFTIRGLFSFQICSVGSKLNSSPSIIMSR